MATVSDIRRLTRIGRDVAVGDPQMNPNTSVELVRIFDQIDVELARLAGDTHRGERRGWWGLWRRKDDS